MANWNPKIPLNFRTIFFCFLMGSVLSQPVGTLLDSRIQIFAPSMKTIHYYETFCEFCLLLLPGWICVLLHCRWFMVLLVTLLVFVVAGVILPSLASPKVF